MKLYEIASCAWHQYSQIPSPYVNAGQVCEKKQGHTTSALYWVKPSAIHTHKMLMGKKQWSGIASTISCPGPRVSSNLLPHTYIMFGPLIDAPPSYPDTILTALTYMQRSLIDMDMKYIQLSIDIQRFLHYETGMLVSANAVQECGGPPWWYACYTILWLHCRKSSGLEVYEAAAYTGLTGIIRVTSP